jgi:AsmA protein
MARMNRSWIKRIVVALGVFVLLLAVAGAVLVATFDANRYKGVAIDWMKRERNRTLAIDGPVGLSVFPRVELSVAKLRLSERGRPDEFLAVDSAGLALELLPLLRRELVVDRVQADGVRVKLTRDAKGVRNTDDLAGAPPPASAPAPAPASSTALRFDVSALKLSNLRVTLRDDVAQLQGHATLKSLSSGRIGSRSESPVSLDAAVDFTQPKLKGALTGKTTLALDLDAGSVRLADMQLAWKGDAFDLRAIDTTLGGNVAWDGKALAADALSLAFGATRGDIKLAGSRLDAKALRYDPERQQLQLDALKLALAGTRGTDPLKLSLDWPQLQASASELKGSALSGSVSTGGASKLDGTFRSGAPTGSFEQIKLPALALDWKASSGARATTGKASANVSLRPKQSGAAVDALQLQASIVEPGLQPLQVQARGNATASAKAASWTLAGTLNEARFDIAGSAALGGAVPSVKAQAKFDALDLNRLLGPAPAGSAPGASGDADAPVNLQALKSLDGTFAFSAGSLVYRQYKVADARADATLDGGVLRVSRLSGKTWGGAVDASALADAKGNKVGAKLAARGVDVNALLRDVAGKDLLDGTGKVDADLTSNGATVAELRSRLAGTASFDLRDGAIKGYNLAKGLRQAKAALSMKQDAVTKAQRTEKTDFSSLSASARIAEGVARSDDLELKSPFLRVGGAGAFDIGKGRIDYVAKATVTGASTGQDGAELAALRGVTVPVRLSGPFEAIDWNVQWSGVAAAALENRLKDKLAERLGIKPADKAASQPDRKPALKDQLRNLLR